MSTSWSNLIFQTIPSALLDYRNEVGIGILKEAAQELAYPHILSPSQQELLSWHHHLYHLPFARLFQLAQWIILPQTILGCEAKPPLCVACQNGQAHCHPWRSKTKAGGSIRHANETQPGDGTSVDQIVSGAARPHSLDGWFSNKQSHLGNNKFL